MTKTIVIAGVASGIGLAIAQHMARDGWTVGMIDLSDDTLQQAAQTGSLHAVSNNADILRGGPFAEAPLSDHHSQIEVNIKGLANTTYLAFPHLKNTPGSTHMINTCSVSAI